MTRARDAPGDGAMYGKCMENLHDEVNQTGLSELNER